MHRVHTLHWAMHILHTHYTQQVSTAHYTTMHTLHWAMHTLFFHRALHSHTHYTEQVSTAHYTAMHTLHWAVGRM